MQRILKRIEMGLGGPGLLLLIVAFSLIPALV